ncbi:MAG: InlB B-repeat-containing protein, partial [Bacteroidaceae bacterium]|nr:InlB B-repeat-containing protein [Bacteroidaceae bacterium]
MNIKNLTLVSTARDHKLFIKRNVLAPSVSVALTVPGGISDSYQYYIPGGSQRILTANVGNMNTDVLDYTYQWYKDGTAIVGATSNVLTLDGNVSDSGTYKVEVTATLKDGANIVVGSDTETASKEQNVKILHATNTLSYEANGGEGGPQSSYTGGTSLNVSKDVPTRSHHDFIGWNTAPDGTGDSYKAEDVYTFVNDNGNGGCEVTLYAQWKLVEYTVTYKADGEPVATEKVEHGKDATLPAVPTKDGYVGKWDSDGKNITGDTTITAVYTSLLVVKPNEVKPEDKTGLENVKAKLEEELKDDSYTDDDKKDIQDAIDDINDALEVIGNVEAVEKLIDKLPDTIRKDDEPAIKAADDAYNALTDYEKSLVSADMRKALADAKEVLAALKNPAELHSPQTGHDS